MPARQRARRGSPLFLPSAFDLFKPSRDLFLENLNVFGILYIVPLFFWLHSWAWTPATNGHYWNRITDANYSWSSFPAAYVGIFIGFSVLWFLFVIIAATLVNVMMQRAQLDAVEGHALTFARLWTVAKENGWRMFKTYITVALIIVFSLAILSRRYILAPYVMLEKKCSVKEALAEAHSLSNRNPGSVWGLIGVMFLISLLGVFPVIGSLASFILGALYSIAPAIRYQQLKKLG